MAGRQRQVLAAMGRGWKQPVAKELYWNDNEEEVTHLHRRRRSGRELEERYRPSELLGWM
jgi:hypothetical protein